MTLHCIFSCIHWTIIKKIWSKTQLKFWLKLDPIYCSKVFRCVQFAYEYWNFLSFLCLMECIQILTNEICREQIHRSDWTERWVLTLFLPLCLQGSEVMGDCPCSRPFLVSSLCVLHSSGLRLSPVLLLLLRHSVCFLLSCPLSFLLYFHREKPR